LQYFTATSYILRPLGKVCCPLAYIF
jgi:hypothetical protein